MTGKLKLFSRILLAIVAALAVLYLVLLLLTEKTELPINPRQQDSAQIETIAIFGATGTIGDGLLKAALSDPDVKKIHVITRRPSPRIDAGVDAGKITMTIHRNYQDYSAIQGVLGEIDTVFWAIGLSAVGLDEKTYREIHSEFPSEFVQAWLLQNRGEDLYFHYVSGAGAKIDSGMMWAREKARAEMELSAMSTGNGLRVISYRPAFITPTEAERHFGHKIAHALLAPLHSVVRVEEIGESMLEATRRQLENATILENKDIIRYSNAYRNR